MLSKTAEKLSESIIKAKSKKDKAQKIVLAGGLLFWAATCFLFYVFIRQPRGFMTNPASVKTLMWWLVPAAIYIAAVQRSQGASKEWSELRSSLNRKINPAFCRHDERCDCREAYLDEMEKKGIDLRFW
ncbi:MAG: hypothetical protein ACM3PP_05455 [Candidatus Saccharibacteria bacterium]